MPVKPYNKELFDPFIERVAGRTAALILGSIKPELLRPTPVDVVEEVRPADVPANAAPKTVAEFCASNKISRSTYCKNRPLELRIGRAVRISPEAEDAWRRKAQGGG